jgi:hypothetical protein
VCFRFLPLCLHAFVVRDLEAWADFGESSLDLFAEFARLVGRHFLLELGEQFALFFVDVGLEERGKTIQQGKLRRGFKELDEALDRGVIAKKLLDQSDLTEVPLHFRKQQGILNFEVSIEFCPPGALNLFDLPLPPVLPVFFHSKSPTDDDRERQGVLVLMRKRYQAVMPAGHKTNDEL